MTTLRQVAIVSFLVCLSAGIVMADDSPKTFSVPEDKIEFQLYPFTPVFNGRKPLSMTSEVMAGQRASQRVPSLMECLAIVGGH